MALRLVLVGLVAGLGLSLPNRHELGSWGRSAETWVNSRLAEWDAGMSVQESVFVYVADREPSKQVEAPADRVVRDDDFAAVVSEQAVDFAQDAPANAEPRPVLVVAYAVIDETPQGTPAGPEFEWPTEPAPEPEAPAHPDVAFNSVVDDVVEAFRTDLAAHVEPISPDREFVVMVDAMAASFAEDTARLALLPKGVQEARPSLEPWEDSDDPYTGEAYALNGAAEGIVGPATDPSPEPPPAQERLTNAVRLTREAVFAWASLLHGPAVVTISR